MHKGLKKGIAVLAAAVLFCGSAPVDIYAANTVTISTRKDFLRFAKNCTLDSWSTGKTVVLTADIDLGRVNFSSIPIFGGTFEGNGHTISGLNLEQDGSQLGLFRYVAEGGVVKNLKVEGNVTPGGSRSSRPRKSVKKPGRISSRPAIISDTLLIISAAGLSPAAIFCCINRKFLKP